MRTEASCAGTATLSDYHRLISAARNKCPHTPPRFQKICSVCGIDMSQQKRVKDPAGRYTASPAGMPMLSGRRKSGPAITARRLTRSP